ncbi:MAG TPA: ABC transporter ATP-binding protein [Candidatus Limnocylindria bacterium]|nr:ABC transporter ATP-binding protein [Candidatus Limnocylindria bacterium]
MKSWVKGLLTIAGSVSRLRPHMRMGRTLVFAVLATLTLSALLEGFGLALLMPLLGLMQTKPPEGALGPIELPRFLDLFRGLGPPVGTDALRQVKGVGLLVRWIPGHSVTFYIGIFCALVFFCILAKNGVLIASQLLSTKLRARVTANLRGAMFTRLHQAELQLFQTSKAGELASVFSNETQRAMLAIDHALMVIQRSVMAVVYISVLLYLSWRLTFLSAVMGASVGVGVVILLNKIRRIGRDLTPAYQAMMGFLTESFGGVRVVRARNAQAIEIQRYDRELANLTAIESKGMIISSAVSPIAETLAVAGGMGVVGIAYYWLVARGDLTIAALGSFCFILLRLMSLLNQTSALTGTLVYMGEGLREIERWLQSPVFPKRPFGTSSFDGINKSIVFRKVGFTYPDGKVALHGIDLEIPVGTTLALVGESGSGKSTLANLLIRLREPSQGVIEVDGRDYWDIAANDWHKKLGVVDQEPFLFNDTIEANLRFGRPAATAADLTEALRIAHLTDVVSELPEGLATVVGERGSRLSGGQRQRVSLARAMVGSPSLLILDEATSALDNYSEQKVQAALEDARLGRTVVVIAHRLSTIRHADRIVVMEDGRIIERGTWEELMRLGGSFARMVNLSTTGSIGTKLKPDEKPNSAA